MSENENLKSDQQPTEEKQQPPNIVGKLGESESKEPDQKLTETRPQPPKNLGKPRKTEFTEPKLSPRASEIPPWGSGQKPTSE
ncbi:hypothetical protein [Nostoc sp. NMS8]|uniref:hypothetical protein n=1 Tax=Nostoc sp. NMS8 TaxID=2815392 RepID=UPI0026013A72|nr:hypothetical protein [Nostoc sp. NMS8]MBN3958636.1 hypothetical protein [Nostoc sp. NMS8]